MSSEIPASKTSFWQQYRQSIELKADLKELFFRPHARFATIDGIRGFTILLMVLLHVVFGAASLMRDIDLFDDFVQSLPRWMDWTWQVQGSDPLFVVCGLLISYTLFREMDKTGQIDMKRYLSRRFWRIYPVFLLAVLLYLPGDDDNLGYLPANLLFLANLLPDNKPIIPVGWSLEVQILFYLILPFLVLWLYKLKWRISILVGLCLFSFAYRYWYVINDPLISQTPFYMLFYDDEFANHLADKLHYDFDVRMGNFFLGILIAELHFHHGARIKTFLEKHFIFNTALFAFACYLVYWSVCQPVIDRTSDYYANQTEWDIVWFWVADRYVYCLACSIIILQVLCPAGIAKFVEKFFALSIWHPVAQLVLPIYLFHFPLVIVAAVIIFGTTDPSTLSLITATEVWLLFFLSVFLTMIFSVFVHLFVEKPFIKFRNV